MAQKTSIEWTDGTWSVTRGCSRVSRGCGGSDGGGCYAERMAHRFSGRGAPFEGLTRSTKDGPRWTGDLRLVPEALDLPMRWKKPRRIFVNSMSDLFHEDVPDKYIAAVFGVMAECPQHTFQILTKRPERMRRWFDWLDGTIDPIVAQYNKDGLRQHPRGEWYATQTMGWADHYLEREVSERDEECPPAIAWPLPNVQLGVSVENRAARSRLDDLRATPAALRFLSLEPLLGPIDDLDMRGIGWVIVGGESGPGARPCDVAWIRSIVRQCRDAHVSCFVKQLGAKPVHGCHMPHGQCEHDLHLRDRKGGDPEEWPEDLRVREMPEVTHG